MKRKILAILTTACLVLTMFPVAAFAGEPTPATWSNVWWGDNCLSDSWYVANKNTDYNSWYKYTHDSTYDELNDEEKSDNWINYEIKSTLYDNPGFWVSLKVENKLKAGINEFLDAEDLDKLDPDELAAVIADFQYGLGEYLNGTTDKWNHKCTGDAEAKVKVGSRETYFHDIDNALRFVYDFGGTLIPIGDAEIDGMILESDAWMPEGSTSDTWVLNKDMTLDLSDVTPGEEFVIPGIVVPVGNKLTVKGESGVLDLNGNHFDVQGSLVIDNGAVVEAGSDSWAIETTGKKANVVINGQLKAAAKGIKADNGAKVTINGVLDAADKGIQAAKYTTVTVNGALEAGENGIEATDATVNVKGELFAGVNGIEALGQSKVTVDGDVLALRDGIVAKGCSQVDINTAGLVVSIRGINAYDNLPDNIKVKLTSDKFESFKRFAREIGFSEVASDDIYVGVRINESARVNIAGTVMGRIGVLQDGVRSVLNITGGIIAGLNNAIVVNNGVFNINAEEDTLIISENGDTIVLNKGTIVPSITAAEGVGLVVATEGDGSQAVVVNPEGAFFKGGFISAGFYNTDVTDNYIKTGFQDKLRVDGYGDLNGFYEVVPCNTITGMNVSLDTYVVNYVNSKDTPKPKVTVKVGNTILQKDKDYTVTFDGYNEVGKAKVTVKAIGDNYKGEVVKYYYVKGPVTPGTITDPGVAGYKYTVKVIGNHFVYNGQYIRPLVTVKFGSLCVNPLDYTVTYVNNLNAGTATVKVTSRAMVEVEASADTTKAPKFKGEAEFKIEKRNLYIIPNSYTKKLDGQALKFDASAYGFIPKDANDVKEFISKLDYRLLDKDGKIVADTELVNAELFGTGEKALKPGTYQIVAAPMAKPESDSVNPIDNYNIIISAKGKLVILDANGKAPVVDFNGTGNSLLDMINKSIQKAAGTLGDTIKDTVVQPVKVISQLEKAVERAQNLWLSLNKGLHPVGCHCAVCTIC